MEPLPAKPSREVMLSLLVKGPVILFATDTTGKFTYIQGGALATLDKVVPRLDLGESFDGVFKATSGVTEAMGKVLEGEVTEIAVKLGQRWFNLTLQPWVNAQGKIGGMLGLGIDVTELAATKIAVGEAQHLYKSLFDAVPVGLGIADLQGNLIIWNEEIMKPGGYLSEDIKKLANVSQLYYDAADRAEALRLAKETGHLDRFETRFRKKDGGFYFTAMSLRQIDYHGKLAWLALVEDISEREQAEAESILHSRELENLNKLLIGREVKMVELKKKLSELEAKAHD